MDILFSLKENKMEKIQFLSDLHPEVNGVLPKIIPIAPVLIIAGDCTLGADGYERFEEFIRYCSSKWKTVIYVPGNHDFYHGKTKQTMFEIELMYNKIFYRYPNTYYLNNRTIVIGDIAYIGSCLWANVPSSYTEDYHNILRDDGVPLTSVDVTDMNSYSIHYISEMLKSTEVYRKICITHFPPIQRAWNPLKYSVSPYFENNLEYLMSNVLLWIFGHTHYSCLKQVENCS